MGVAALALLVYTVPARAQEHPAAPLTAAQIVERLNQMNQQRAQALHEYTSVRVFHIELNGIVHKTADMTAKMTYRAPDQKEFTIVSESGSEIMRNRVLKGILAAEKEALTKENRERTALNEKNYDFTLEGIEGSPEPQFYVLRSKPRSKNKFLFNGKVWVDAKDFAVTRVECEPAKNPSWWTKKNDITTTYRKVGDFWLPAHTQSLTEVRIFGHTELNMEYKDYELVKAGKLETATAGGPANPPAVRSTSHPR